MHLAISEIFGPTIQGEGKTAGKSVIFLRLAGCNLACIWCDTPHTWNWFGTPFEHTSKFNPKQEVTLLSCDQALQQILEIGQQVKSLVISGGEPLLQQNKLIPLLSQLKAQDWYIEVETNGTVVPESGFLNLVDQVNCSPKLSTSGKDNDGKRICREALLALSQSPKTIFKFVVKYASDMEEVNQLIAEYAMREVYLMPEGQTKAEQENNQDFVANLAAISGLNFSPRLHVLIWGSKRGV